MAAAASATCKDDGEGGNGHHAVRHYAKALGQGAPRHPPEDDAERHADNETDGGNGQ